LDGLNDESGSAINEDRGFIDWWEVGWYAPFAVNSEGQFLSNGGKIRNLFVVPDAEKRRTQLRDAAFFADAMGARNTADHWRSKQGLGVHRQSGRGL
jgi:hypothetical protein